MQGLCSRFFGVGEFPALKALVNLRLFGPILFGRSDFSVFGFRVAWVGFGFSVSGRLLKVGPKPMQS